MKLPRWLILIALLASLAGVALRFQRLGAKPFWYDELATIRTCVGYERLDFLSHLFAPPVQAGELAERLWNMPPRGPMATVRVLATEDQNHTPLYYLATRYWMDLVGWSPVGARSLAALFGIAAIGAAFFAGAAIDQKRTGFILAILVAASPYHLVYSQEAREYALWTAFLFFWTASFARLLSENTWKSWSVFTVTAALAHYVHPLSLLVACGQFGATLGWRRPLINRHLLAGAIVFLLFSPWILVYAMNVQNGGSIIGWMDADLSLSGHMRSLLSTLARPFLDLPLGDRTTISNGLVALLAILLSISGLKRAAPPARLAVASVLLAVPVVFFCTDLLTGGRRSAISRFHTPTVVGLQMAVALGMAGLSNARLGAVLGVLLAAGFGSGLTYSRSDSWWSKGRNATDSEFARAIVEPGTLATTMPSIKNPLYLLPLAAYLDPSLPIVLLHPNEPVPEMRRPVYVVTPSRWSDELLAGMGAVRIEARHDLWKID